ncbi:hypothetical protein lerEdw1_013803 [Lerista edwardsae]|nr:hypothetical protein lerEdw1_013803 [Lerista edwardsae]
MGTGASISICQTLSSIKVRHCTNKVGPEPQKIFGIPLDNFTQEATFQHVPLVVKHMTEYLEEFGLNYKGLFRINGSATRIKELKQKYDQGQEVNLVKEGDVHSVASLLKLFLNELPVPVFPDNLYTDVLTIFKGNTNHVTECTRCLQRLLSSLPRAHYSLFHYLIRFLAKVASHSDVNHMTLENLAVVFGPTFFRIPCSPSACEKQRLCNDMLLYFLQHHEDLFVSCPNSHFSPMAEDDP